MQKSFYIVFLINSIPNKRVWNALGMRNNLDIIEKVLCSGHAVRHLADLRVFTSSQKHHPLGASLFSSA